MFVYLEIKNKCVNLHVFRGTRVTVENKPQFCRNPNKKEMNISLQYHESKFNVLHNIFNGWPIVPKYQ